MREYFSKPGNMLYPVPAVMVTVADGEGRDNIITLAWAGTVCSDPPMVSISVRKNRFSHPMLMKSREFAVNLVNEKLVRACDLCGCTTGAKLDKFETCGLTRERAREIGAPLIAESPVSLECRVTQVLELGSHDLFLARVLAVKADAAYLDERNVLHLEKAGLIAYSHGKYQALGEILGTFGYSVRKRGGSAANADRQSAGKQQQVAKKKPNPEPSAQKKSAAKKKGTQKNNAKMAPIKEKTRKRR